jgi:hypothetical protein
MDYFQKVRRLTKQAGDGKLSLVILLGIAAFLWLPNGGPDDVIIPFIIATIGWNSYVVIGALLVIAFAVALLG